MPKDDETSEKKKNPIEVLIDDFKRDEDMKRTVHIASKNRLKIFFGLIMLIGIIISFFNITMGGGLVGLAFGLSSYREIRRFFARMGSYTTNEGLFKTGMIIATLFFIFITVTTFVLGVAIGFFIILITRRKEQTKL